MPKLNQTKDKILPHIIKTQETRTKRFFETLLKMTKTLQVSPFHVLISIFANKAACNFIYS